MKSVPLLVSIAVSALAQVPDMPLSEGWLKAKPSERKIPTPGQPLRAEMLAEVRFALTNETLSIRYGGLLPLLAIELGDEQAIKRYAIDEFLHRSGGASPASTRLLSLSSELSVIPVIASYLGLDEPTTSIQVEDVSFSRPSVAATVIVLSILRKSEQVSPDTRKWAHDEFYAPIDRNRSRSLVRTFWAENAPYFSTKQYKAVRPPGTVSSSPAAPKTVPEIPAVARPSAKRAAVGTATNVVPTPPIPSSASAVAVVAAASSPLWPWLLVGAGSVGGWLWWRSR